MRKAGDRIRRLYFRYHGFPILLSGTEYHHLISKRATKTVRHHNITRHAHILVSFIFFLLSLMTHSLHCWTVCVLKLQKSRIMQIMTGIEVNSEANFPKLREYCPRAEGTWAIFPQLREIIYSLTIDRWWQSLFVLLYLWSKWRRN